MERWYQNYCFKKDLLFEDKQVKSCCGQGIQIVDWTLKIDFTTTAQIFFIFLLFYYYYCINFLNITSAKYFYQICKKKLFQNIRLKVGLFMFKHLNHQTLLSGILSSSKKTTSIQKGVSNKNSIFFVNYHYTLSVIFNYNWKYFLSLQ